MSAEITSIYFNVAIIIVLLWPVFAFVCYESAANNPHRPECWMLFGIPFKLFMENWWASYLFSYFFFFMFIFLKHLLFCNNNRWFIHSHMSLGCHYGEYISKRHIVLFQLSRGLTNVQREVHRTDVFFFNFYGWVIWFLAMCGILLLLLKAFILYAIVRCNGLFDDGHFFNIIFIIFTHVRVHTIELINWNHFFTFFSCVCV